MGSLIVIDRFMADNSIFGKNRKWDSLLLFFSKKYSLQKSARVMMSKKKTPPYNLVIIIGHETIEYSDWLKHIINN